MAQVEGGYSKILKTKRYQVCSVVPLGCVEEGRLLVSVPN